MSDRRPLIDRLRYTLNRTFKGGLPLVSISHRVRTLFSGRKLKYFNGLRPCPKCGDLDQVDEGPSATCRRCNHEYFA
jgi:hypothetical protein